MCVLDDLIAHKKGKAFSGFSAALTIMNIAKSS